MSKYKESKSERIQLQRSKIVEQGYSIEAQDDEIEHLREIISQDHSRIVELIEENDRLTLAYEPYHPPGDENENVGYYDLIEENDRLTNKALEYKHEAIQYQQMLKAERAKKARKRYAGCVSFDFWPLTDFLRLKLYRWSPGKAFQACVGPVRIDWFQS